MNVETPKITEACEFILCQAPGLFCHEQQTEARKLLNAINVSQQYIADIPFETAAWIGKALEIKKQANKQPAKKTISEEVQCLEEDNKQLRQKVNKLRQDAEKVDAEMLRLSLSVGAKDRMIEALERENRQIQAKLYFWQK